MRIMQTAHIHCLFSLCQFNLIMDKDLISVTSDEGNLNTTYHYSVIVKSVKYFLVTREVVTSTDICVKLET